MDFVYVGRCDEDWIDVAQDKDKWTALVEAVMSLGFQQNAGSVAALSAASRIALSCMELVVWLVG